uniref:NADH-ubiquinone oxidoreductase chain 5 n=1 Tax=Folsomotoma octooculata TaxID=1334185 RepID=A0A059PIN2_9HEXA|nr:NADH dehydrogenase subunit 5 [Folsomotoma octooculata]AGL95078.1 NADH dehydrogenase subunit 5 [Folsomotoma octooculata]
MVFNLITYYLGFMLMILGLMMMMFSFKFYFGAVVYFVEWEIISLNSSSIIMTFIFDWMSLGFMGLVMFISSMVMFYSTYYMEGDKHFVRFIMLVFMFVLSMMLMILSPNLISILLGWDGLGLVSYCLVIYYQNIKSANAGMITILSNRVGDVAILISIAWLMNFGSWNFFYLQMVYKDNVGLMLMVCVFMAAMTKSAQIPFSAWLPAAMAAPTPVSALVHSSTLVTAGVYLLIRFNYMIGFNMFLFYIGCFTMFMSGLGANYENDLKKIIALSTLSQLGLMVMTLSLGMVEFSFFHLMTHAMFKSLLFLCAGCYIHSMGDTQDIRHMGSLMISCPITSFFFICSSMALCGVPFLSGFYSKDLILEMFFMKSMNTIMFFIIFLATLFTLTYSVRLMYFIFFNNMGVRALLNLGETLGMTYPMGGLMFLSMYGGCFMGAKLFPSVYVFLPFFVKTSLLIMIVMMFMLMFWMLNIKTIQLNNYTNMIIKYAGSMWFLPMLSTMLLMPILSLGLKLIKYMDQGWLEYMGGQGVILYFSNSASIIDYSNFLNIKYYLFIFFVMIFMLFMYF